MTSPLRRDVRLAGAVLMGLGSIVGTGVFVSLGIAVGVAGPAALLAVVLAAGLALCNGLSSAQLAAAHPVSGGTYEYGYRFLTPALGFTAGWTFLLAKSASAATAALGLAGYLLGLLGLDGGRLRVAVAVVAVAAIVLVVAQGIRRSTLANAVIVSVTLVVFGLLVGLGLPGVIAGGASEFRPLFPPGASPGAGVAAVLHASALLFVAYTGYGRIATLGEEVHAPERTIPRAIVVTLVLVLVLYAGVVLVAVGTVGADAFAAATDRTAAPLRLVALEVAGPWLAFLIGIAAVTAMLGVLLNLVLGLSRVLLAMGRRGDAPRALARVGARRASPTGAVVATGGVVAALALLGDIRTTWSFSAFTVLIYYAVTNLAALRLPREARRHPRWIPVTGLLGCVGLAFWVDTAVWLSGLALLAGGLLYHTLRRRLSRATE